MDARTAKRIAEAEGLELYYDTQWRTWGLVDPSCRSSEESEWMSPGQLHSMTREQFMIRVGLVTERRDRA